YQIVPQPGIPAAFSVATQLGQAPAPEQIRPPTPLPQPIPRPRPPPPATPVPAPPSKKYGGLDLTYLQAQLPKIQRLRRSNLGPVDVGTIVMSLKSGQDIHETLALNMLTVLCCERNSSVKLPETPELAYALISLSPPQRMFVPIDELLQQESYDNLRIPTECDMEDFASPFDVKGKSAAEKAISALQVLRNLTLSSIENQVWLGNNREFLEILLDCLAVSPYRSLGDSDSPVIKADGKTVEEDTREVDVFEEFANGDEACLDFEFECLKGDNEQSV
ncbi:hypothetical protein HK405_000094, partial [Cladochytrium tenue]